MSMPPTTPRRPPALNPLLKVLRRLSILAIIVIGGYGLLIAAWVLLNPRW